MKIVGYRGAIIRGLALGSKFLLIFFLAKYLSPQEVGVYGLFSAAISFGTYIVGLDFYVFSIRKILKDQSDLLNIIRDQCFFYLISYILIIPLLAVLFKNGYLENVSIGWFVFILISEHLSQEIFRLLVALRKQIWANIILFLKSGLWSIFLICYYIFKDTKTLDTVWLFWFSGNILAIFIGLLLLRNLTHCFKGFNMHFDSRRIIFGLKECLLFFISTLALRSIFTLDRYFLKVFSSTADVGVYTFYIGITNALQSIWDAAILSVYYPEILEAYNHNKDSLPTLLKNFKKDLILTIFLTSIISIVSLYILLHVINRNIYIENINVYFVLLIAFIIFNYSYINHYCLYAAKKDFTILFASILALACFVFINYLTGKSLLKYSTLVALLCSAFIMYTYKAFYVIKYKLV